ncbi:unnamed protein product [Protopolystoma xenopodis]|uniref:Uncharacterized protein n=1 Tax=Protopolystoma xenopodis TaxID=117903 RepID=A0A3S5BJX9_9PLAT|nr:unnamed protein product [Protopolystoma xenopodis]
MFFSGVFGLVRPTDSPETMEMSNSQISHDSNSDDAVKIVSDEVDEILSHRNESLRLGSIQELIPDTQAFSSEISTSFSKTETIEAKLQTILASKTPWGRVKEIYYLE